MHSVWLFSFIFYYYFVVFAFCSYLFVRNSNICKSVLSVSKFIFLLYGFCCCFYISNVCVCVSMWENLQSRAFKSGIYCCCFIWNGTRHCWSHIAFTNKSMLETISILYRQTKIHIFFIVHQNEQEWIMCEMQFS